MPDALTASTSTGRQGALTKEYLARLEAREDLARSFYRMRLHEVRENVQGDLDAILARIAAAREAGEVMSPSWLYRERRYRTLMRRVLDELETFGTSRELIQEQKAALGLGRAYAHRSMQTAGVDTLLGDLDENVARTIVAGADYGTPLDALLAEVAGDTVTAARSALVTGVSTGKGIPWIRRRFGQAMDIPRWRMDTIARTESQRAFRAATQATFQENAEHLEGWVWTAALDSRTCPACVIMHGTIHAVTETLDGHPNCRCAMVPRTPDWDDILGPGHGLPDTRPTIQTGKEWLEDQDDDVQRAVLGPGKWQAWKDGKVTLDDLVTQHDSPTWGTHRREATLAEAIARSKGAKAATQEAPIVTVSAPALPEGWDPRWEIGRDLHVTTGVGARRARREGVPEVAPVLPDFNPDNPLEFYGDRVHVHVRNRTTAEHLADMAKFSPGAHRVLRDYFADRDGAGAYFGDAAVPELDDMGHLRGVRPRGWPEGSTWDDVGGAHSGGTRVLAVGDTNKSGSVAGTALHEGSHALDEALGGASSSPEFRALVDTYERLDPLMSPYFTQRGNATGYTSETFAEGMGAWQRSKDLPRDDQVQFVMKALRGGHQGPIMGRTLQAAEALVDYFADVDRFMASR